MIARAAGLAPGVRALEIGCGTGNFTEIFARSGATILALDISQDLLALAAQRGFPSERVTFLCQRFEDASIVGPFDCVLGSSILHHLQIAPALVRIADLLRPGGTMAFAEPNMLNPQIFAERTFLRRFLPQVSPDETAFVRFHMAGMLRKTGFVSIRVQPFGWLHPSAPQALIRPFERVEKFLERTPWLREFSGSLLIQARKP